MCKLYTLNFANYFNICNLFFVLSFMSKKKELGVIQKHLFLLPIHLQDLLSIPYRVQNREARSKTWQNTVTGWAGNGTGEALPPIAFVKRGPVPLICNVSHTCP